MYGWEAWDFKWREGGRDGGLAGWVGGQGCGCVCGQRAALGWVEMMGWHGMGCVLLVLRDGEVCSCVNGARG